jgi:O-antigen biosynthesis protein WbqP
MKDVLYRVIKRLFDIVSSAVALILLLPLWIVAIIGIEISDFGPVFYLCDRVGKDNKHFRMYKFRSMRVDKSANEKSLRPDQNRIFKFGEFIRSTKIDELPQLINVLIGDMSVIGPRPASADQISITRSGKYERISELKPGLSSPSAIYDYIFGDDITSEAEYMEKVFPTRMLLDLYYLKVKGLGYDIKMIWWTILSILAHGQRKRILKELIEAADTVTE